MTRSLEEIEAQEKELAAEKKQALKEHKKNAVYADLQSTYKVKIKYNNNNNLYGR